MKSLRITLCSLVLVWILSNSTLAEPSEFYDNQVYQIFSAAYEIAREVDSFDAFVADLDDPDYTSHEGVLYYKTTLLCYPGTKAEDTHIIPEGATAIYDSAFNSSDEPSLKTLQIPSTCTEIDPVMFDGYGLDRLEYYSVSPDNPSFADIDGILVSADKSTLISYPRGRMLTSVTLPPSIQRIGNQAFIRNSIIEEIVLPDGVQVIGDRSFEACTNLSSISWGSSLSEIGVEAFIDCASIEKIVLPATLRIIYPLAFSQSHSLSSVILPEGLEEVGDFSFVGAPIREIYLPSTIKSIGPIIIGLDGPYEFKWRVKVHTVKDSFSDQFVRDNFLNYDIHYYKP